MSPPKVCAGVFVMGDCCRELSTGTNLNLEADIYKLSKHKLLHVAKAETGGNFPGRIHAHQLRTVSQGLLDGHTCHHLCKPLQQHHIFLRTATRCLTTFAQCRTLVTCVADAMQAAQEAFDRARILYKDITVSNIIIAAGDRGVLIDWDDFDSDVTTRRPRRLGTWPFLSVHSLTGRSGAGDDSTTVNDNSGIDDSKESAFWVLLYVSLRYLKQDLSATELYQVLSSCYDARHAYPQDLGGFPGTMTKTKLAALKEWAQGPGPYDGIIFEDIPQLNDLMRELAESLVVRYVDASKVTSAVLQRVYENVLKAFGPDSDEAQTSAYGGYLAAKRNMESATWFCDTLRAHAEKMPSLPTPTNNFKCDHYINAFYPMELCGAGKRKIESRVTALRADFMHSLRGPQRFDDVEDVEPKQKRRKTEK